MYLTLKKPKITHWWVAQKNLKMAFVNILSGESISENLLIVGYLDKDSRELATSTNRVIRVTEKGVITEKGTFYPFKEAHKLYLQFLIEANKENTLIATNWDYSEDFGRIIADVVINGNIRRGVDFDFYSNRKTNVILAGYSNELSANVVLTTFAKRNVCIMIGIPASVKSDIYTSLFGMREDTIEQVIKVQEIFRKNSNGEYIIV